MAAKRVGFVLGGGGHLGAHEVGMLQALLDREITPDVVVGTSIGAINGAAACIETASERWFSSGPLVDAVMASSAVPGLLPPVEIDGEHFLDGGIVNSIPVGRAVAHGARTVYVMHVGRVDRPLEPPRWPWEVALVAFEIARRHRFMGDLASLPENVEVHVMPTGQVDPPRYSDLSQFRYRDTSRIRDRIERAHAASLAYLAERGLG